MSKNIKYNKSYSDLSSSDLFSHDVNITLQEAREIITEGKARDNPNENLIKDSSSVKVKKTGSFFDPIEVTISRSRIVSNKINSGYYSDSDIQTFSTKDCISSLKSSESHGTLIKNKNGADNSHKFYRYRRKNDELWHIDNDEVKSNLENEAQLEVDVKEEHCTDKGSQLIIKVWEAKWTVQHFDLLPDWLQDNEFLRTGHRPPLSSFSECFKSIWSIHTETGNIWTHLLGCVAFFVLAAWYLTHSDIQFQEKIVFSFFFIGAILCLGLSFTFHTVSCHSVNVFRIFSKLDYMGISLLIIGSFIPWIYYGFYCRLQEKISYITMVIILGIGGVIVSLWDKFSESNFRPIRAAVFVTMGLSGLFPTLHFIYTDGLRRLIDENSFYWLIIMAILYLFGALLYATRTPERFFPGKCDYLFQSHQLFHMCVVCAAFIHYCGISKMAMNRLANSCGVNTSSFSKKLSDEL